MPIQPIILQRRLVEVGRIRLGAKKTSARGKEYPTKLEQFRLTSRDKQRLDAAAALYGGTVTAWEDQWELFTEADSIPVVAVPGQALSQSFELWGQKPLPGGKKTAVICLRRCDGVIEQLTGDPCPCALEPAMQCKPTTRLSVVLTEVPGLGVWRCESHGWNAAAELAGGVQLLEALIASGRPVRARLRLDKRESKTETETRQFVVPVLDIDHTIGELLEAAAGYTPAAIEAPAAPAFTPVPVKELAPGPNPSIAEQLAGRPEPAKPRANAQVPIPPTGLAPGSALDIVDEPDETPPLPATPPAPEAKEEEPPAEEEPAAPTGSTLTPAQFIAIRARENGVDEETRHAAIGIVTRGRTRTGKEVTAGAETTRLIRVFESIKAGAITVARDGETWTFTDAKGAVMELRPDNTIGRPDLGEHADDKGNFKPPAAK